MEIQFICNDPEVIEHFPVKPSKKTVNEWFKGMPTEKTVPQAGLEFKTIKECMPAMDMMTSGYTIFNTYELEINPTQRHGYEDVTVGTNNMDYVTTHHHEQCPVKIDGKKKHFVKIHQPWLIKTPPGYSCLFMQPFYELEQRYRLMPAIVDTDKHDLPVLLPGYTVNSDPFVIEPGVPLMQVIPFKREDWNMEILELPARSSKLKFYINGMYRKLFHTKKKWN
jgi:hypothetical protein